ncbi:hypothetical protein MMC12_006334 [Toensbergia leucococca]|nr:hypothetical protein [Toensbergia leucococca]
MDSNVRLLPDGRLHDRQPPSPSVTANSPNNTPPPNRQHQAFNQQTRRLQLRNAGFRAPILPPRRLSPIFSPTSQATDRFSHPVNDENSPRHPERRKLYGEDLPPSPVNILQEIHNSTQRKRKSPKPSLAKTLHSPSATASPSDDLNTSWYRETSITSSPLLVDCTPSSMMKLKEGTLNQKTPPSLNSPLAKKVKARKVDRVKSRSPNFEASSYIEHLESQLAAVNTKLDSLTSPTRTKAQSAKLRALTLEARSLRQELCEWEKNFTERVGDEREHFLEAEVALKARVKALEDDMEIKDIRIRELEWEIENTQVKLRDTEALEDINRNLERRIDVLTELLVQSPSRHDSCSAVTSPSKADPLKRTPRPRSMLAMVPSSPGGVRLSLGTVSESEFWHSRTFGSTSSISESPEVSNQSKGDETHEDASEMVQPNQSESLDSSSGISASFRSMQTSSSRPTSIQSSSSLSATAWNLPLPANSDVHAKSGNRQRRMRRFPSGSCSLKPLILPTAAVTPSLPASAPIYALSDVPRRDLSSISLDPTTAFLTRPSDGSPFSTPTQPGRRRSATWAQKRALDALEGRLEHLRATSECEVTDSSTSILMESLKAMGEGSPTPQLSSRSRPQSLMKELEAAEIQIRQKFEDGLIPVGVENYTSTNSTLTETDDTPTNTAASKVSLCPFSPCSKKGTPESRKTPALIKSHPQSTTYAMDTSTSKVYGMFTRLTNLIGQVKQDPFVLAQRILYNAWTLGCAGLGGMGWWLLGLLFGSRRRKRKHEADRTIGEEDKPIEFLWHQYSAQASNARIVEHYLGNKNGAILPEPPPPPLQTPQRNLSRTLPTPNQPGARPLPCKKCVEPSSRRTLRLWFRFSLTIVLAVGIAIKHGPGVFFTGEPPPFPHDQAGQPEHTNKQHCDIPCQSLDDQADSCETI